MEFGTSFEDEIIYMGDVPNDSKDELEAFLERAREWKNKHGIVIGEGTIKTIGKLGSELGFGYQLRAPRLHGPAQIVESVR